MSNLRANTFANSSFLKGCIYDVDKQLLTVIFKNDKEYPFANVPMDVYEGFVNADSAGSYFSANIKGKYEAPDNSAFKDANGSTGE